MYRQFIKNSESPVCKICKYFVPHSSARHDIGLCSKFGEKNVVSGYVKYNFASVCRGNTNLCGEKGVYFEPKNNSLVALPSNH